MSRNTLGSLTCALVILVGCGVLPDEPPKPLGEQERCEAELGRAFVGPIVGYGLRAASNLVGAKGRCLRLELYLLPDASKVDLSGPPWNADGFHGKAPMKARLTLAGKPGYIHGGKGRFFTLVFAPTKNALLRVTVRARVERGAYVEDPTLTENTAVSIAGNELAAVGRFFAGGARELFSVPPGYGPAPGEPRLVLRLTAPEVEVLPSTPAAILRVYEDGVTAQKSFDNRRRKGFVFAEGPPPSLYRRSGTRTTQILLLRRSVLTLRAPTDAQYLLAQERTKTWWSRKSTAPKDGAKRGK